MPSSGNLLNSSVFSEFWQILEFKLIDDLIISFVRNFLHAVFLHTVMGEKAL